MPPDACGGARRRVTTRPRPPRTCTGPRAAPATARAALAALAGRHNAGLRLGRLGRWAEAGEAHRAVAAEREPAARPGPPRHAREPLRGGPSPSAAPDSPAEALAEYTRLAGSRERVLGADHPDTLAARQETAYVLGQLGRHFEAHQVYTAVLATRERALGARPPRHAALPPQPRLQPQPARAAWRTAYRMADEVAPAARPGPRRRPTPTPSSPDSKSPTRWAGWGAGRRR